MALRVGRWIRHMRRRFGSGVARTTRRTFRPTRRARTRYSMRRFVRRPMRSELKWTLTTLSDVGTGANAWVTNPISPVTMSQGTGEGQRIGNQCKFLKLSIRFLLRDDSYQTYPLAAPLILTGLSRIIFWTPRIELARVINYFTTVGLGALTNLDYNVLTVHKDMILKLSPSYMQEATSNDISGAPRDHQILKIFNISFPRSVKFSNVASDNDDLDNEKDVMYYTVCSGPLATKHSYQCKLWYKDA